MKSIQSYISTWNSHCLHSFSEEMVNISCKTPTLCTTPKIRERALFFLGRRVGEFWYVFQKTVLALPHVLIKKLLTPLQPPPPFTFLGGWQKCDLPLTTTWYAPCHRKIRTFCLWTQNVWIWIYLDIEYVRAETRKCKRSVWDLYVFV